jgi:hypothetical protein
LTEAAAEGLRRPKTGVGIASVSRRYRVGILAVLGPCGPQGWGRRPDAGAVGRQGRSDAPTGTVAMVSPAHGRARAIGVRGRPWTGALSVPQRKEGRARSCEDAAGRLGSGALWCLEPSAARHVSGRNAPSRGEGRARTGLVARAKREDARGGGGTTGHVSADGGPLVNRVASPVPERIIPTRRRGRSRDQADHRRAAAPDHWTYGVRRGGGPGAADRPRNQTPHPTAEGLSP